MIGAKHAAKNQIAVLLKEINECLNFTNKNKKIIIDSDFKQEIGGNEM